MFLFLEIYIVAQGGSYMRALIEEYGLAIVVCIVTIGLIGIATALSAQVESGFTNIVNALNDHVSGMIEGL